MADSFKKIIHCPYPIGGNPAGLSEAENAAGFESHTLDISVNRFGWKSTFSLRNKGMLSRWLILPIRKIYWGIKIPFHYDIVHYNYGSSLATQRRVIYDDDKLLKVYSKKLLNFFLAPLEHWDVKLAKFLKCKIVVTYQGDDARQRDYCLHNFKISHVDKVEPHYYSKHFDYLKRCWIDDFDALADSIWAVNPDLLRVLPKRARFIGYACVDAQQYPVQLPKNRIPKILHAPSHRKVKGTDEILQALSVLKAEGFEFELMLVENMPNEAAKVLYLEADILIDQIYVGWYGGLALELMAMGKVVASYIRESDLSYIPSQMQEELPIFRCDPTNLVENLRDLLSLKTEDLKVIGQKSRQYSEKWHNPHDICRCVYKDLYSD